MEVEESAPQHTSGGWTVAIAAIVFAIASFSAALRSDGFLDADAATHYAFARFAAHDPYWLVNVWGRPLTTCLFVLPVKLAGRMGAQMVSLACALVCSLTAWRLALLQQIKRPALAALFTLGQPLLFLYSFSEMTELPFAALLGLTFLAYRKQRWWLTAALGALLPLGRPEGFGFLLLLAIALILHRQIKWLLLLPLPLIAWDLSGWALTGMHDAWPLWIIHNWPYSSGSDYPHGSPLHFVMELPALVSPVALPAVWIGLSRGIRNHIFGSDHSIRCQWLIAFIPAALLIAHSLFFSLGCFSSDGELRYLLIASPFWGWLAADGWNRMFPSSKMIWPIAGLLAPAAITCFLPILPIHPGPDWQSAHRLVAWYESSPLRQDYPHLAYSHPAILYYLDTQNDAVPLTRQLVVSDPAGCVLVWDPIYSPRNADPSRDVSLNDLLHSRWTEISLPAEIGGQWRAFLSRPQQSQ